MIWKTFLIFLQFMILLLCCTQRELYERRFTVEYGNGYAVITDYDGFEEYLYIPDTIRGTPVRAVRSIGVNYGTEHIIIPDSVALIDNPFDVCFNLNEIVITKEHPNYVQKDGILYSRDGKRLICCPANLPQSEYNIPEGVMEIGRGAFSNCRITHVLIPDTVEKIEKHAFDSCHSLETIHLSSEIRYIGEAAFNECGLRRIDMSCCWKLQIISRKLFANCWQLEEIILPETIREIQEEAFNGAGLKEITIPFSVRFIGGKAFVYCENLEQIILEDTARYCFCSPFLIDRKESRLMACAIAAMPAECCIPAVEVLDEYCLAGCHQMVSLEIPSTVRLIKNNAVLCCAHLESVLIDDGHIDKIGDKAFADNWNLRELTILADVDSFGNEVLHGVGPVLIIAKHPELAQCCLRDE